MGPLASTLLPVALLLSSSARHATGGGEEEPRDLHRPPCATTECRTIKAFLKQHYCGESPFGNGPADGCDIRAHDKFGAPKVKAEPQCEWDDDDRSVCRQNGDVPPELRAAAIREMRRLGLPAEKTSRVLFVVWELPTSNWSLVEATYSDASGAKASLCKVIVLVKRPAELTVIREVRFHQTDADVPRGTTWELVDFIDVDGDGRPEIVLEGNSYEDHWLEVVRIEGGFPRTVFSGLGYNL